MLGGLKHKKGRISNDVGWRKPQEGEDFQAICPEVETAKCIEGRPKLEHAAGFPGRPRIPRRGVTAGRTNPTYRAHAFRMTLVASKLPQINYRNYSRRQTPKSKSLTAANPKQQNIWNIESPNLNSKY